MLKSRRVFPPGGFQWLEPQTQWSAPPGLTFDQVVDALIAHRKANPRFNLTTDRAEVEKAVDSFQCIRIANNPEYCDGPSFRAALLPQRQSAVQGQMDARGNAAGGSEIGKYIKNTAAGIGLYVEWFGTGSLVEQAEAERRAEICLSCPKHVKGNFFQRWNIVSAKEVMTVFKMLKDIKRSTKYDEQLSVCDPCDCPIGAKIWAPKDIIMSHIRPESAANLWEKCWLKDS